MRCGGYDYATGVNNPRVALAYDAVVAIARAAHEVVKGGASECVCERVRERVRERSLRQKGRLRRSVNYNFLIFREQSADDG